MRRLQKARRTLGLSQKDFAKRALLSPQRLSLAEAGIVVLLPYEIDNLIFVIKDAVRAYARKLETIRKQIETGRIAK